MSFLGYRLAQDVIKVIRKKGKPELHIAMAEEERKARDKVPSQLATHLPLSMVSLPASDVCDEGLIVVVGQGRGQARCCWLEYRRS